MSLLILSLEELHVDQNMEVILNKIKNQLEN
jgi:hypothetical protein